MGITNVAAYDDDRNFLDYLAEAINAINIKHKGIFSEPVFYSDEKKLIDYCESNKQNPSVYLLDIMTDDIQTGFDLGQRVKEANTDNKIIYITDFKEEILSNMVQKMLSLGFILKDSARFCNELEEGLLESHDSFVSNFLIGRNAKKAVKVKFEDIYYIEKIPYSDYSTVVHKNGCTNIRESLSNLIGKLNDDFCYSSKEYIINRQRIESIDRENKLIRFENGKQCPYSRTRSKEVLKWL